MSKREARRWYVMAEDVFTNEAVCHLLKGNWIDPDTASCELKTSKGKVVKLYELTHDLTIALRRAKDSGMALEFKIFWRRKHDNHVKRWKH